MSSQPRSWVRSAVLAVLAVVLLALAACSTEPVASSSSHETIAPSGADAAPGAESPSTPEPTVDPGLIATAVPQSGADIATSTYTLGEYVSYILASADTYWTAWMTQGYGLQEPYVYTHIVDPGTQYQTTCKTPDGSPMPPWSPTSTTPSTVRSTA